VDGALVQQQDDRSALGCESEVLDVEQFAADVDAQGQVGMPSMTCIRSRRSTANGPEPNLPDVVGVRDSKDRSGPVLAFDPRAWADFLRGVKSGEFDLPA
jgi:hypothetical protein